MPYLTFSSEDFTTLPKFSKFVTDVLSRRDNLTEVHSVKLSFRGKMSQGFVKRILSYAVSHNVQQLNVVFFADNYFEFPLSLVSSQSLKHLSLAVNNNYRNSRHYGCSYSIIPTSTWELPALTTLELHSVALCDDEAEKCVGFFTKCANLKNLTLKKFLTMESNGFTISHPLLSNLTLENGRDSVKVIKVVAPHLENLTMKFCQAEHVISAPHLVSLFYSGSHPMHLSIDGLHSLEKADICVSYPNNADQMVCLLQQLYNVRFLTLNLEIVELLSSSGELVLHQPSPFVNLKRLNIYPNRKHLLEHEPKKVAMSTELKSYLLDGSPGCTFTMILREEAIVHELMAEFRVLLRKDKDNIKTESAHVEQRKVPVESHEPKKLKIEVDMAQIKGRWENLGVQIQLRKKKACLIISKLQRIKDLLTELPATNRAKMRPCFSSLCEEANIAISKTTNCMKIQCDESQSSSSIYFHELATTLELSP
ncbi:putative F-box/FBD/LRR-repeat protein At4g03220 [Bidens hawaiensis]|uniref:putative F-box/FBD/LRR-repeat protein At4g03220 n=1 Tax=Bidens hawaiensis TaxID=980011 RepID=UPI00404A9BFF